MACKLLCLSRLTFLHLASRNASPQFMRWHMRALKNHSSSGNDGSLANVSLVEHRCVHADQRTLAHGSPMHHGPMSHRHIVFKHTRDTSRLMHTSTVLNVHAVAAANGIYNDSTKSLTCSMFIIAHC